MSRELLNTAKITGPGAASAKYDVLTALLALATQGEGVEARLALRLSLLITARYNWRRGSFAVGQRELARMWGVTERTVKREMAELRGKGWIVVDVPAARGRVASYKIDFETLLIATEPFWETIGKDFVARIENNSIKTEKTKESDNSNVVSIGFRKNSFIENPAFWRDMTDFIKVNEPKLYHAWVQKLIFRGCENGVITLEAPSVFVANYVSNHIVYRLLSQAKLFDPSIMTINLLSPPKGH